MNYSIKTTEMIISAHADLRSPVVVAILEQDMSEADERARPLWVRPAHEWPSTHTHWGVRVVSGEGVGEAARSIERNGGRS